MTLRLGFD